MADAQVPCEADRETRPVARTQSEEELHNLQSPYEAGWQAARLGSSTSCEDAEKLPTCSTYTSSKRAPSTSSSEDDDQDSLLQQDAANENSWKGWLTALGAFFCISATIGVGNVVGLLQRHLEVHQLKTFTPRDIGWIAATNNLLALGAPALAGPLFDRHGPRWLLVGGAVAFGAGTLSMSAARGSPATNPPGAGYAGLLVAWGLLCGAGMGVTATAAAGCVNAWFARRRGVATGLVYTGSSAGGVAWPMMLRGTLARWGWGPALRALGGATLLLLVAGNVLVKSPPGRWECRPEDEDEEGRRRPMMSARCMRKGGFVWMTASFAVFQFVMMAVVATLPSWGAERGFDRDLMFDVVAVMNAGSAVGRITVGALADCTGRFNTVILVMAFSAVIMFGSFLTVGESPWRLYLFAPLWGFAAAAVVSMMPVLVGEVCDREEFGTYFGTSSIVQSLGGFLCVPLSAQILTSFGTTAHVVFFGGLCVLSTMLLVVSRWAFLKWTWAWLVKV